MHYSGILITTRAQDLMATVRDVEALPGVGVHYCYPESGRLIAVQETGSAQEQQDGLRRIQSLAGVVTAALVEHRVDLGPDSDGEEARSR